MNIYMCPIFNPFAAEDDLHQHIFTYISALRAASWYNHNALIYSFIFFFEESIYPLGQDQDIGFPKMYNLQY